MTEPLSPPPRLPWSIRQISAEDPDSLALMTGVSDGLRPSLLDWTCGQLCHTTQRGEAISLSRVRRLERQVNHAFSDDGNPTIDEVRWELEEDDNLLLNVADSLLQYCPTEPADQLDRYLVEARSAYCVGRDEVNRYQLQLRQAPEMAALLHAACVEGDRGSQHLTTAWSRCFGLEPDPKRAYMEAVMAVEVVAKPAITPDDPKATLGKMCAAMRAKPTKWDTDSLSEHSVETILAMMDMIWDGQPRHGDSAAPLDVPQSVAEMTVHLATLLVSWFRSGRIRLAGQLS